MGRSRRHPARDPTKRGAQHSTAQQQFSNGIQAPTALYIPGLGLSVAIGNVPGFYTDTILENLFAAEGGALGFGDGALTDWGVASLANQAVRNTINTVNDAAVNSQTITVG